MHVILPCGMACHMVVTHMNPILLKMYCQHFATKCACASTRHMKNLLYNNHKNYMYVIFPCGITWHLIITFMNPILHEMHCQYYAAKCACVSTRHMMNLSYNNYKDWMHVILPCFMKCQKVIPNMNHFLYKRNAILIINHPYSNSIWKERRFTIEIFEFQLVSKKHNHHY